MENGNVASAHNYLPRGQIAPPALAWLDRAFVAGHLSRAEIVLQGPIRHFPFRDGSGLFLARCALDGMTLDYGEGWPRVENLAAQAEFRNEGMTARLIPDGRRPPRGFGGRALRRFQDGRAGNSCRCRRRRRGRARILARLAAQRMAEHAFSSVEAKGPMQDYTWNLFLPFKDFVHRRVLVHGQMEGVTLNRPGSRVTASELNGDFDIDGAQVARADVRGRVLGGPFQMAGRASRSRPLTRTQLEFRGTLSGEALRAALSLPATVPIGGQDGLARCAPNGARARS